MGHILGEMILPRFDEFVETVEDCQVKLGVPSIEHHQELAQRP